MRVEINFSWLNQTKKRNNSLRDYQWISRFKLIMITKYLVKYKIYQDMKIKEISKHRIR
jgi:hypothetical protein